MSLLVLQFFSRFPSSLSQFQPTFVSFVGFHFSVLLFQGHVASQYLTFMLLSCRNYYCP